MTRAGPCGYVCIVSLLVQTHGERLHRLEQCRQQKTDGARAEDVHSAPGGQDLEARRTGLRGIRLLARAADRRCSDMSRTTPQKATRPGCRSDYAPTSAPASTSSK